MDGFCWWVVRVMAEALIAKLLDWLLEKLKERLSPKNDGKHFKGGRVTKGRRLRAASLRFEFSRGATVMGDAIRFALGVAFFFVLFRIVRGRRG